VYDAVLDREVAHSLAPRREPIDRAEVVFGAVPMLLLGEGGTEVILEIAAEG
jgi:hypothetical protein